MKKILLIITILITCLISGCYANSKNELYFALEHTNSYSYVDESSSVKYLYDNNNIQVFITDNEISMLTYCDALTENKYIIKTLKSGNTEKVEHTSEEFNELVNDYIVELHLKNLVSSRFLFNGISYSLRDEYLDDVSKDVFNGSVNGKLESFECIVKEERIIEIKILVTSNGMENTRVFSLSNYDNTDVDIPFITGERVIVSVRSSIKLFKVMLGTTLDDAVKDLFIYIEFEDGKEVFDLTQFDYSSPSYDPYKEGSYEMIVKVYDKEVSVTIEVIDESFIIPNNIENIQEYGDRKGLSYGMPSTGNSKALVIPVEFTDYRAPVNMKQNLEKAFFGDENDTGWESLTSYYNESSYGKLNIEGKVLDVFNTGYPSTYYDNKYKLGENADYLIIKAALEYYDNQIDYDAYDSNKDGYIDALYIMYTAPINYTDANSMWWAFTYEYFTDDYEYYDNVEADYYCFIGYDFLFEIPECGKRLKLNTETIIHETGHLLGIPDYYDYDEFTGPDGGLGGGDMMDHNVGDHNPFTKILLGWVTPYVVKSSTSIELRKFSVSGDCILLTEQFSSIYSDYFLIDFYSPTGLNKLEAGYNGLFSCEGIRIYRVNAQLNNKRVDSILDSFQYDNSYTVIKLIKLIQASGSNSIEKNEFSTNADLFSFSKTHTLKTRINYVDIVFKFKADLVSKEKVKIEITKEV